MCAGCAMSAAAAATGARSFLQANGLLGRRAMKVATVALCTAAIGVSTIGVSGSTASAKHAPAAAQATAR